MPHFGPISRRALIANLRRLGFSGPYPGGKHQFMLKGTRSPIIPNPHRGDLSRDLLARILDEAGVSRDEWEAL